MSLQRGSSEETAHRHLFWGGCLCVGALTMRWSAKTAPPIPPFARTLLVGEHCKVNLRHRISTRKDSLKRPSSESSLCEFSSARGPGKKSLVCVNDPFVPTLQSPRCDVSSPRFTYFEPAKGGCLAIVLRVLFGKKPVLCYKLISRRDNSGIRIREITEDASWLISC